MTWTRVAKVGDRFAALQPVYDAVIDRWGRRRIPHRLGTLTLAVATALYVLLWWAEAPFWQWVAVSLMPGLGFTFFSGATEAWLVDALTAAGFEGTLESVFGRGQVVNGAAMLVGSVAGGFLAQLTNLGIPFLLRTAILLLMFSWRWRRCTTSASPAARRATDHWHPPDRGHVDRVRLAGAGGEVSDARLCLHRRCRGLCLLCPAAAPT
jgi:MFS family permease